MTLPRTIPDKPEVPPAAVRPVRRDPKTGWWLTYPAYDGWKPRQAPAARSGWILAAIGAALVLTARILLRL